MLTRGDGYTGRDRGGTQWTDNTVERYRGGQNTGYRAIICKTVQSDRGVARDDVEKERRMSEEDIILA